MCGSFTRMFTLTHAHVVVAVGRRDVPLTLTGTVVPDVHSVFAPHGAREVSLQLDDASNELGRPYGVTDVVTVVPCTREACAVWNAE